jgi:serine/threonine protein kinase
MDDYDIVSKLGEGGFGEVMLGKHKESKNEVAIKFMDVSASMNNAGASQGIYKEAESLKKLRHKHIIELYHVFLEGKQLCMIMEYAGGGELLAYVEQQVDGRLNEVDARTIIF